MTDKTCETCKGTGWICENHMDTPWGSGPGECDKCKWCGHSIDAHDRQYGCAEDGCDCETPNAKVSGGGAFPPSA